MFQRLRRSFRRKKATYCINCGHVEKGCYHKEYENMIFEPGTQRADELKWLDLDYRSQPGALLVNNGGAADDYDVDDDVDNMLYSGLQQKQQNLPRLEDYQNLSMSGWTYHVHNHQNHHSQQQAPVSGTRCVQHLNNTCDTLRAHHTLLRQKGAGVNNRAAVKNTNLFRNSAHVVYNNYTMSPCKVRFLYDGLSSSKFSAVLAKATVAHVPSAKHE